MPESYDEIDVRSKFTSEKGDAHRVAVRRLPLNPTPLRMAAGMLAILSCAVACGTAVRPSAQKADSRAIATSSPKSDPTAVQTPFRTLPLLVVGDSIMVGARDIGGLQGLLEGSGWDAEIVAEVGVGLPWAIQRIEQRQVVPRVVVVELGTNPSPLLGNFENEAHQLIDDLVARGARHILWITPEARDPTEYAEKDAVIARAVSSHVHESGWAAKLQANPQWFGADPHLTQEGYVELATFLTDELRALHG